MITIVAFILGIILGYLFFVREVWEVKDKSFTMSQLIDLETQYRDYWRMMDSPVSYLEFISSNEQE